MKKMAAFLMAFALACTNIPADLHAGTETVYAAQAVAISSEADLIAMQENPDGNYYLAKDITIKENLNLFPNYYDYDTEMQHKECFTGSLDGRGHKIKNYTGIGLFDNAKNATFKNIVMTNVTLETPEMRVAEGCAALVLNAKKCVFSNITVSGKAKSSGAGIVYSTESCNFTKCISKVDANVKERKDISINSFAGITRGDNKSTFKSCKNKGNITLTGKTNAEALFMVFGIAGTVKKIENCVNSGNITIKNTVDDGYAGSDFELKAGGLVGDSYELVKGCGNTGKISVTNKGGRMTRASITVSGVIARYRGHCSVKQCYNKGTVSFEGICAESSPAYISGIGTGGAMTECYNTGKIIVNTKDGVSYVGGVAQYERKLKNCYNAGTVSLTGKGYAGGVAGDFSAGSCNYNVGKVTAKGKNAYAGEIAGYVTMESSVDNNYYTGSGKKSGGECTSWVPYQSKAKKVSSITFANCPKLSSKYWTYSGKHKRLILKNNKEA